MLRPLMVLVECFLRDQKTAMAFELGLAKYGERCVVVLVVVFSGMEFIMLWRSFRIRDRRQTVTLMNEKTLLF
jgi:hypothetical protein